MLEVAHENDAAERTAASYKQQGRQSHRDFIDDYSIEILTVKLVSHIAFGKCCSHYAGICNQLSLKSIQLSSLLRQSLLSLIQLCTCVGKLLF